MASSYGSDASRSALEARYVSILPKAASPSLGSGLASALERLCGLDAWHRAPVVLVPTSDLTSCGMARVAARALEEGKRLGVCAWRKAPTPESEAKLDFVEATTADAAMGAARTVPATSLPEGDTTGFSCEELMGAICVVPGLVFDGQGHFVGSDHGAYARFLRFFPGHKVALVDALQISSNPLPRTEGDVPVDLLVTPSSVWRCR